jgi:predicted DCC family thiol-disulfide oxidoreductase YuxK
MLVMPTNKAPLILFDGVCNLCNASVAWVIEHDRRGVFQFASLQSAAGRAAIAAANGPATLPDSMVLIDDEGVHTQSEAVIRIANRLGLPWKLARLGYLLPKPIRDWAYNTIARNRYRWFGRRESCLVPTPELRARFLDADEPPPQQPAQALPADSATPARFAAVRSFALRWLIAYLFLHMFPFPIGAFPFTEWPAGLFDKLMTKLVPWVGKIVFGLKITIFPGGSGDTTYNYVEVFLFAVVALGLAFAWTLLRRGRPVTPRAFDAMQVLVRYYLGMVMLSYGWHKVIPLQFPVPGPDRLLMSYGDSSPMGLLWAFMGASKPYVIFSGLAEVVGGFLLFFRRTAVLGGLVSGAVLTNITLMNFCYDVPVKLYSSRLLIMAIFVVAPHAVRLFNLFFLNFPVASVNQRPWQFGSIWLRRCASAARLVFIAYAGLLPAWTNYQMLKSLEGPASTKAWAGYYRVESFTRDEVADRALPDSQRWVRVGISYMGLGVVLCADGSSRRQRMEFNQTNSTVTITRRGEPQPMTLKFKQPEPGVLALEGRFDGGMVSARLRRQDDAPPLLISRGFHWINEFPFNR